MIFAREFEARTKRLALASLALSLSACATYLPQRYGISADNNVALKAIGGHINVGQFTRNERVTEDLRCRGSVDPIEVPGVPFEDYVQRAFSEELKVAGVFDARSKIVLSGVVEGLELSTVASGYWAIDLRVNSTNGKSAFVREHYDFPVAFDGLTACKWAADAYLPAVQDLIGKLVTSPDFKALIEP